VRRTGPDIADALQLALLVARQLVEEGQLFREHLGRAGGQHSVEHVSLAALVDRGGHDANP